MDRQADALEQLPTMEQHLHLMPANAMAERNPTRSAPDSLCNNHKLDG